MNKKIVIVLLLASLTFTCSCFCETIIFKSGKSIEAKIIKKSDKEIMTDNGGVLSSYYLEDIESIDGKNPHAYVPAASLQESEKKDSSLLEEIALNNGLAFLNKGRYDEASAEFTKAIEINPHFTEAYYNRGLVHAHKGDFDQAIVDYTKAIENNSNDADIYYNRGFTYSKKGSLDEAIADYTKAIELSPNQADVYYNRALIYITQRKYDKAWDDVHKAQSLGRNFSAQFLSDLRKASGGEK
ncbi:MAG: tetratricopeptide repeat protein [Candidatus Omnitrophica bacterium]|nr:tetratricopeptide repeat protein [Candidatus Omnitrophota bacterium]